MKHDCDDKNSEMHSLIDKNQLIEFSSEKKDKFGQKYLDKIVLDACLAFESKNNFSYYQDKFCDAKIKGLSCYLKMVDEIIEDNSVSTNSLTLYSSQLFNYIENLKNYEFMIENLNELSQKSTIQNNLSPTRKLLIKMKYFIKFFNIFLHFSDFAWKTDLPSKTYPDLTLYSLETFIQELSQPKDKFDKLIFLKKYSNKESLQLTILEILELSNFIFNQVYGIEKLVNGFNHFKNMFNLLIPDNLETRNDSQMFQRIQSEIILLELALIKYQVNIKNLPFPYSIINRYPKLNSQLNNDLIKNLLN
jgi:hypothetical protein